MRAAQWLGVEPGYLAPGVPPLVWQERALVAIDAESRAEMRRQDKAGRQ